MRYSVRVTTRSSRQQIKIEGKLLKVHLRSSPVDDKANEELVEVLSNFFDIAKSKIKITRGKASRNKVVDIED